MDARIKAQLEDAAGRAPGNEVTLTIRDFISWWGAQRRGYWYVRQIREDLERVGLTTLPTFETGWIDNHIRLVPVSSAVGAANDEEGVSDDQQTTSAGAADVALTVGTLKSSSAGVVSVCRDDTLSKAQSLMLQGDYSQLPVLQGQRKLLGAVSWESMAQVQMHQPSAGLRDCMVAADAVGINDDLIAHIPRIADRGYVFVRETDESISGVVTTADLSAAFLSLAEPFLLIGEVERRLRRIVSAAFPIETLKGMRDPSDTRREINSADDLTVGEHVRLFESKERWAELGWQVDREVFIAALHDLRELRNDVTHFNPDPPDEASLRRVRNLLKWLKLLAA